MIELTVSNDACMEVCNILQGVFHPLNGFMNSAEYRSVVENARLTGGEVWPLPVTLDVPAERAAEFGKDDRALLKSPSGEKIAELLVDEVFRVYPSRDALFLFGTDDRKHPGVAYELSRSPLRAGGVLKEVGAGFFSEFVPTPKQTKEHFRKKGWEKIASFQTRNPPHRAHEYLQRIALEVSDGLFIQPLIGWKKKGDFTPEAIMGAYRIMIESIFPADRVLLGALRTPMRYAGPREAVFHALIRRNYGCTSFIVGRDHAGVGSYYGKYEAQRYACSFGADLGIEILPLAGPMYCERCGGIATERTCGHGEIVEISGTGIRKALASDETPDARFMRPEIAAFLKKLHEQEMLFCR